MPTYITYYSVLKFSILFVDLYYKFWLILDHARYKYFKLVQNS
jgi:hypothetical protein